MSSNANSFGSIYLHCTELAAEIYEVDFSLKPLQVGEKI